MLNGAIRWRKSTSVKVTVSEILLFQIYDLEILGQGHEV